MKLVYTHENRLLVGNAQNILEQAGIQVIWKNEFASGATGELSSFDAWPELWVLDDNDYTEATAIIASSLSKNTDPEWTCATCNENNDAAFEFCWNCQSDKI
jgi:hypothetical protein